MRKASKQRCGTDEKYDEGGESDKWKVWGKEKVGKKWGRKGKNKGLKEGKQ